MDNLHNSEAGALTTNQTEAHHESGGTLPAIDMPQPRMESDEAAVVRLAALPPLAYDRVRKSEAETMGVQLPTLDGLVKSRRKENPPSSDALFDVPDPWHEPVDPALLLDEVVKTIRRFIVCDSDQAALAALWTVMTHLVEVIHTAPILTITAPEKGSGKTQLLSVLGKMVLRPLLVSGISAPALFRLIEAHGPTMLIDETDTFLADNEGIRQILNAGHTRDTANVFRCAGDDHEPKKFNVYGAKALSGINNMGRLNPTLIDRSVIIELQKKLPSEQVEKLNRHSNESFRVLRAKIARYALDYSDVISNARPIMPVEFDGRLEDNFEPIFAIADTAGSTWSARSRHAAVKVSASGKQPGLGTELLADIKEIFENRRVTKIHSIDLVAALCRDAEKQWATYNRGYPITYRQLAILLRSYGIKSHQDRIGHDGKKGYRLEDFANPFARYLPSIQTDTSDETAKQPSVHAGSTVSDGGSVSLASETLTQCETQDFSIHAGCSVVSLEKAVLATNDSAHTGPDDMIEETI